MLQRIRLHLLSSLLAGILSGASALAGAITQMIDSGKSDIADISELVWLVCIIWVVIGFAKDARTYLRGVDRGSE